MKYVLITGASSGIGRELAKEFAKKDHDLILVARREELLQELKEELEKEYHVDVVCYACDIAKDPKAVYDFCRSKDLKVSVLVNNAGYGDYGPFIDADLDKLLGMIELNDKALVALTYHFLKDMKEEGYGHIINTGSVASFIPGPYMGVYYATKAFVLSFSLALREELKDKGIHVSVLCPAPTKSPFWSVAGGETTAVYDNILARTAKNAARTGYDLYDSKKAYAIDGPAYKLLIGIARHLPLEVCARVMGFLQSRTKKQR